MKFLMSIIAVMAALTQSARAVDAPLAGQTQAETSSWTKQIGLSIGTETYGPSLTEWDPYRPDLTKGKKDNTKDLVRNKFKVTPSYKVGASTSIALGIEGTLQATKGYDFTDPYLAFRDSKLINAGTVTTDASARLYGGFSSSAATAKRAASVRLIQGTKWNVDSSRWTLEFYSYYQRFFYNAGALASAWSSELYLVPGINYRTSSTLQLQLQSKTFAHEFNNSSFLALKADPTVVSIGVSWDAVPGLNINPFIDTSPSQGFSPEYSTVGLFMSWKAI